MTQIAPSRIESSPYGGRGWFRLPLPGAVRRRNLQLWAGLGVVGAVALLVLVGPFFIAASPFEQDLSAAFAAPSAAHPLGTDQLGRDILARLLHGGRTDLSIAFVAVVVPLVVGTALGALAGYFGGWLDTTLMRLADLVSAFPFYVLVITLVFVLGNGPLNIFIAISAVSWVAYARIVRGETLVLREREFIAAARAGGLSTPRVLVRHVVPNAVPQAVTFAMSDIVLNIGVIVTLSYFGIGVVPPLPDWGQMMSDGQQYLAAGHYALTLLPGTLVVVVSLGLALLGDGLVTSLRGRN